MSVRAIDIGIDVGGTFTDLFVCAREEPARTFKVLSTPKDPSIGVIDGLRAVAESRELSLEQLARRLRTIVHGTTVTTNATLTRGGAKTALLTTAGVRDALEMRRGVRERQYDNRFPNVVPLVPRYLRRGLSARLDYAGREIAPLDRAELDAIIAELGGEGVEAVAVCMLNAFANPAHEAAVREALSAALPDAFLSVSSDVLPTIRFYNRVSTTVLNAYVGPVLRDYLRALTAKLAEVGFDGALMIMQSSGGVALPELATARPAMTLLSGPAAGPRAAAAYTEPMGRSSCLVVDMGGTSFDASLVRDGEVALKAEGEIDRLRSALPMLDIITIGAGGGSIGWIDAGGLLRMGPQSAGADPGPACYGRGGELPTCTDANVLLGYLDPAFFAGGAMQLDLEAARRAIEHAVARPLGLDVEGAAAGMYRVINVNMAYGVREITVKRGLDPRDFPMVVAGGAGALHACMIAQELELDEVIVPPTASILCAAGMLFSDLSHDFVRSHVATLDEVDLAELEAIVSALAAEGDDLLEREGVAAARREHLVALDLRYRKQYHEVSVPVPRQAIARGERAPIVEAFHAAHDQLYGYHLRAEGTPIELINVRVRSVGRTDKPALEPISSGDGTGARAAKGSRRAYVPERLAFADVAVYDGPRLGAGDCIAGPALIERSDTTVFVSERFSARVDEYGTCVLERRR